MRKFCVPALPPERAVEWFLRILGLVWLCALASLWNEGPALFGSVGIQPAHRFLACVQREAGAAAVLRVPSVLWLGDSPGLIRGVVAAGGACAALMALGRGSLLVLAVPWLCLLSLVTAGGEATLYIWDQLLLEAGALSLLLARTCALPSRFADGSSVRLTAALHLAYRWLLFKLWMSMGIVKVTGSERWLDLSYVQTYFLGQPMPATLAWYADKLPPSLHQLASAATLVLELLVPLLIWSNRLRLRQFAFAVFALLQVLIQAAGNFAWFNVLTVALGLFLLVEGPARSTQISSASEPGARAEHRAGSVGDRVASALAATQLTLSAVGFASMAAPSGIQPLNFHNVNWQMHEDAPAVLRPLQRLIRWASDWRIVNAYGVFGEDLPLPRHELQAWASQDGRSWQPYLPQYRPFDPMRAPTTYAPYFPRMEQQLFYEALGASFHLFRRDTSCRVRAGTFGQGWLDAIVGGRQPVLDRYQSVPPFAGRPEWLQLRMVRYRFTTSAEHEQSGAWWSIVDVQTLATARVGANEPMALAPLTYNASLRARLDEVQGLPRPAAQR